VTKDGFGALHPLRGVSSFMGAERTHQVLEDSGNVQRTKKLLTVEYNDRVRLQVTGGLRSVVYHGIWTRYSLGSLIERRKSMSKGTFGINVGIR
jgi:hypothetical protein